jgi:hypothetical protein
MSPQRGAEIGARLREIEDEHKADPAAHALAFGETLIKFYGDKLVKQAIDAADGHPR